MDQPKWKDTFHYTQSERRGVFILAGLLFLLLLVNSYIDIFYTPTKTDFIPFKKAIAEFEAERKAAVVTNQPFMFNPNKATEEELIQVGLTASLAQRIIKYRQKGGRFYKKEDLQKIYGLTKKSYNRLASFIAIPQRKPTTKKTTNRLVKLHRFDPNTVSRKTLSEMDVSPKAIQQWLNYRSKGGKFKSKEEVRKIYALSDKAYQQLAPYIHLPATNVTPLKNIARVAFTTGSSSYTAISKVKVDVNAATAQDWQRLHGIGPSYAKRIIRFRGKLGGFVSINQIGTTYGLPDSVFQKIKPQLFLSPISAPLAINTSTIETLTAHPYIQKRQAKAIVNYRKNHGAFKNLEALISDHLIRSIKSPDLIGLS